MEVKTHWRRGSKLSFYIDCEKEVGEPIPDPKPRAPSSRGLVFLIAFLILGALFNVYTFMYGCTIHELLALAQFQVDHQELLQEIYGHESLSTDAASTSWLQWLGHAVTGDFFGSSDVNIMSSDLALVDEAVLEGTTPDELWKLDDHQRWQQQLLLKPPHVDYTQEIDPKQDLKEILLVAPVVVLLDDEGENNSVQREFMTIMRACGPGFRLTPEPVVVNLSKHPHCDDILDYLRRYMSHELAHHSVQADEDDIPRLFIGGLPMGNYQHVIESYRSGDLMDELIERGNGLLSIM